MKLYKRTVDKDNKQYIDLFLEWDFNGKKYLVRINPTFKDNFKLLLANAETLGD